LPGSDVGENEVSFWELCNFMTDFNTAAKVFQIASERHLGELERRRAE
jgi:hypothetical protein